MSRNESDDSLKGKNSLLSGSLGDGRFESMRRREIDGRAEKVRQAVLKSHHIEQGEMLRGIKIGDQVNIRCCSCRTSRQRPVQAQMDDAGSFQLRLVFT